MQWYIVFTNNFVYTERYIITLKLMTTILDSSAGQKDPIPLLILFETVSSIYFMCYYSHVYCLYLVVTFF